MLANRWAEFEFKQIQGDFTNLAEFEDNSFNVIICHNVLEYIQDKKRVLDKLQFVKQRIAAPAQGADFSP